MIQVWLEGGQRPIGHLMIEVSTPTIVLRKLADLSQFQNCSNLNFDGDVKIDTIRIPTVARRQVISDLEVQMARNDFRTKAGIPLGATSSRNPITNEVVYSWRVAVVTNAIYEDIFDMEIFEPI